MGVYIKGMEMPQGCFYCICNKHLDPDTDMCILTRDAFDSTFRVVEHRRDNCPLIEVPDPHGRLIDADALHKLFEDQWHYLQVLDWNENPTAEAMQSGINWCINTMHDDAPAVIPASEECET